MELSPGCCSCGAGWVARLGAMPGRSVEEGPSRGGISMLVTRRSSGRFSKKKSERERERNRTVYTQPHIWRRVGAKGGVCERMVDFSKERENGS